MDLYLKEVQMENFKSFGRKISVPFFPGFTAITGPNGSGKSNIADAILFVLGPKSSKVMRAGRLTDLIFNGGKKRKNPAKYCRVSLIFDNTDRKMSVNADEIILTRMIKRAPLKEDPTNYYSYYYINDKTSTNAEFIQLLQDARLTGDGYNIVKQGDVTSIIEMGGVERRKIIDEIAGINHFNKDLNKAESEKNDVHVNMDRINIILREINIQLKQLKNDRDEAIRYNELKQQLYEYKAKIAEKKKQEIQKQIAEIQQQIKTYTTEQSSLSTEVQTLKEQYKEKQEKLQSIEQHIAAVGGDEVSDIAQELEKFRREEIKTEERINYLTDETRELKEEMKGYKERNDRIQKEQSTYTDQCSTQDAIIKEHSKTLNEKKQALKTLKETIASSTDKSMDITQELSHLRQEYDDTNNKLHTQELNLQRVNEHLDSIDQQLAELQENEKNYAFEIKDTQWQIQEEKKQVTEQKKTKKQIEKTLFDQKKQQTQITEQLEEIDVIVRKYQQQQIQLQTEYDAISTMHQKYNRAVMQILKARDANTLQGIHGTIAELAHVDETYKTALAIAAGGRMQSIIVDDDTAAAKAIQYLQRKKLGRATFLPLNKMIAGKPRGKSLLVVKDSHVHGYAIDLVEFQEEYRGAFWYVFGDTIVVDTLEHARRLMGGVRLVDLEGSLIEASGAMKGGSIQNVSLVFGDTDRRKLEAITQKLKQAQASQEQLQKQLTSLNKEIKDTEQDLFQIQQDSHIDQLLQDLELRKKTYQGKLENTQQTIEKKTEEKTKLIEEKQQIQSTIETIQNHLDELTIKKDKKGKQLLSGTTKDQAQQARALEDEIRSLQETILKATSEKEGIQKKIELLEEHTTELTETIKKTEETIKEYETQKQTLHEKRENYREKIAALSKVQEQVNDKIKEYATQRDQIYKEIISVENELDKLDTRIESYFDLISRAKYRIPTLEETITDLNEELKLYNVDLDDSHLPPVESLKDSIRVITESMQDLEPVNMRALDEYSHQEQRKQKLDEDISHLKDQRKNLEKLVREINKKKEERFTEVFHEINQNFTRIYAQLAEGGEAELIIENEECLFESGLTIKARPRGKKILLLSALSGGEKSIASLAFIFAIQQYDPSPFYVLDEVDMFLDGVNAENVSHMIKTNAMNSQFIMVSLRKIALKEADHVYGVTMQEDGLSDMIGNVDPNNVGAKGQIPAIT